MLPNAIFNDGIFNGAYNDENVGAVADFNNIDDTINVSPIPTLRIHKDHPKDQILGDPKTLVSNNSKDSNSHNKHWTSYVAKTSLRSLISVASEQPLLLIEVLKSPLNSRNDDGEDEDVQVYKII
ncbi:hypothetical protein Tco_1276189 [Tanacetum coccineum]